MTDTGSNLEPFLPKPSILTRWSRRLGPLPALHAATVIADNTMFGFVNRYLGAQILWGAAPSPRLSFEIRCALWSFLWRMRARVCWETHACKGFIFFDGCAQQFCEERMRARVGISPACATYMMAAYNPFNQAVHYTFVKRDALLAMRLRTEPATTPLQQQCLWNWEFWSGFQTVVWSCFLLSSEPFWSGFQTGTETGFVPVKLNMCEDLWQLCL